MTEPHPYGSPAEPDPTSNGPASWLVRMVPALTFVVGLLLGGLVIGVSGDDSSPDARDAVSPDPTESSASSDVTVVVPQECLQAAQTVQDATDVIRDSVGAIRDFRPEELITLLDELEDLDARAREEAALCSEVDVSRSP